MNEIINQKIGILGLGEENIALLKYLIGHGAKDITICDRKSRQELQKQIDEFVSFNIEIKYELGRSYLDNLNKFDIIFRAPGLPYLNEKIKQASRGGIKISSAIKLFFEFSPSPIIGVTGTKGKGTTSTLISEMLKSQFKILNLKFKIHRNIYLAGNIGNSPLEFLDKLTKDDIVVLELSSFQLQDMDKSPHIAVVLDIKSDHLDYHQTRNEYIAAKENIVKYQNKNDFAIINADYETSKSFAKNTPAQIYWFSRQKKVDRGAYVSNGNIVINVDGREINIAKTSEILLRGEHNLENICASLTAVSLLGTDIDTVSQTIKTFRGLEHRLEFVSEINNIKFYNDSFSTTPDTAIAAIKSFIEPIILICGGSEKGADYSELGHVIDNSNVKSAILIGKTGPRIKSEIKNTNIKIYDNCQNLEQVIDIVKSEMKPGEVILFSPASASFDWFSNYKERGKEYKKLVNKLKEEL